LAATAIGYIIFFLIGGIPFGLIVARLKKVDLSRIGSGNIGATNVYAGWDKSTRPWSSCSTA